MRCGLRLISGGLLLWAVTTAAAAEPQARPITPQEEKFFESQIRPLLVDNCLNCHGPRKQKSGLRLDSLPALLEGGDNGPVVIRGDPDNSPLVQAVRYNGSPKMPPKGKLNPETIAALAAWVKMGAPWPPMKSINPRDTAADAWKRHWAFQPIQNEPPPPVQAGHWPTTSIDRFILAKLEEKGLTPSPGADRRTLIRRATFDLIGLPPTPEEIAAFEADSSPDAFARVVDRLLASPQYGERWGRYWLDVARYADTKGYVFFQESEFPWAYTYRDYVIRAFNEDLPYDQFVLQQLAADLLPLGKDKRPLTALGFLTLGGRFMNNQQDILDDRIDVVARGLLGLTVTCARCHDHKFDPIPTRDYYSLYGVFASCVEPTVPPLFADPPQTPAYAAFAKELQAREQKLHDFVEKKHTELTQAARSRAAEYLLAVHAMRQQPTTEDFMLLADGADLNPRMLHRWRVYLERTRRTHHAVFAPWHAFGALPEKEFAPQAAALSAQFVTRPDPAHPVNPLVAKAFADKPPRTLAEVAQRYGELLNAVDKRWQESVKQAVAAKKAVPSALPEAAAEELRQVFYGPDAPANVAMNPVGDLDLLPDRPSQAQLQELRKAVETWRATGAGAPPRAMVLEDAPKPYQARVFVRGSPSNLGEFVPRQFLGVLAGDKRRPFQHGSGRLELAQAIVDRSNPLTARVMVNRIWLHHFGAGLVRTPSDFGLRSDRPSHPDLLDHLASTFMANGWSIKQMHRLIMLSAVYQQKSDDRPECNRIDPENVLLWKMNRRRLDFEATRDAFLAVAGRLDRTVGGPPIKDITAPSATRRTVYGFIDRLNLPGLLRTFDFPSPDATSPQRDTTTVPQQALFLMNNPFVIESARVLLQRPEIAAEKDVAQKIARLYRVLYGRAPAAEEIKVAGDYLAEAEGTSAAWQLYAQGLLLANEFVFVD
jgi:mono/diheme cytochrome c family protein